MPGTSIRNETGLRRVLAGTQSDVNVAVAPDYRWLGMLSIDKNAALIRTPENTGTYDGLVTPRRELATYTGQYSESLTYQSFTQHNQYAIAPLVSGVSNGTGYVYAVSPSATADDIAAATLEYGVDGQVWLSSGVRHNEYTITIDTDDADGVWKMSSNLFVRNKTQVVAHEGTATGGTTSTLVQTGAGWSVNEHAGAWVFIDFGTGSGEVRQITSNTTDTLTLDAPVLSGAVTNGTVYRIEGLFTPGLAFPLYDSIVVPGTQLYIDPADGTIGTNAIADRMISYNITVNNARTGKRFADNVEELSTRTGRGKRIISGQVRLEFDRRDEYEQYENLDEVAIRVYQEGPELAAAEPMWARIDVARAVWDVVDEDERDNNITATFGFVAYLPESDPITTFAAKHDLAANP
jgi:hypothetical protein